MVVAVVVVGTGSACPPYNPRPMIVARSFEFQAAHHLPNHPGKCHNLHGHTYRLEVLCAGAVEASSGMVVDFAEVKAVVTARVLDALDHTLLNDRIANPTAERIAEWIWERLQGSSLPLQEIRLYETPTCYVVHRG
jgi:6-pyruvoyltetrahydropterin/6-carboxytetrahydropterin synthase